MAVGAGERQAWLPIYSISFQPMPQSAPFCSVISGKAFFALATALSLSSLAIFFGRCSKPVAVSARWWKTAVTAPGMWCCSVYRAVVVTVYRIAVPWISVSLSVDCHRDRRTIPDRHEILYIRTVFAMSSMITLSFLKLLIGSICPVPMRSLLLQTVPLIASSQKSFSISCITSRH